MRNLDEGRRSSDSGLARRVGVWVRLGSKRMSRDMTYGSQIGAETLAGGGTGGDLGGSSGTGGRRELGDLEVTGEL